MPLQRCTEKGVSGWRWGNSGKCYVGKDSKQRALKQGYAEDPQHFQEEVHKSQAAGNLSIQELAQYVNEEIDEYFQKTSSGSCQTPEDG